MEDEVNERVVSVAFSAARFTATTLARALAFPFRLDCSDRG